MEWVYLILHFTILWIASLLPVPSLLVRAEPTEAVILSIYEGLQPHQVGAIRNNRAAYAERHGYRQALRNWFGQFAFLAATT